MHLYPEETQGPISEVYQAGRCKEFTPAERTPMHSDGLRQFYIDEVAQLDTGELVIPSNWIVYDGVLSADSYTVTVSAEGQWIASEVANARIPATRFKLCYIDIQAAFPSGKLPWSNHLPPFEMPNSLRALADGEDLYTVMVPLWCDDVSGNKSKQYNKHMNIYTANSALPGRLLQQEYFVQFVSTSPTASLPEQFSAIKEQIE